MSSSQKSAKMGGFRNTIRRLFHKHTDEDADQQQQHAGHARLHKQPPPPQISLDDSGFDGGLLGGPAAAADAAAAAAEASSVPGAAGEQYHQQQVPQPLSAQEHDRTYANGNGNGNGMGNGNTHALSSNHSHGYSANGNGAGAGAAAGAADGYNDWSRGLSRDFSKIVKSHADDDEETILRSGSRRGQDASSAAPPTVPDGGFAGEARIHPLEQTGNVAVVREVVDDGEFNAVAAGYMQDRPLTGHASQSSQRESGSAVLPPGNIHSRAQTGNASQSPKREEFTSGSSPGQVNERPITGHASQTSQRDLGSVTPAAQSQRQAANTDHTVDGRESNPASSGHTYETAQRQPGSALPHTHVDATAEVGNAITTDPVAEVQPTAPSPPQTPIASPALASELDVETPIDKFPPGSAVKQKATQANVAANANAHSHGRTPGGDAADDSPADRQHPPVPSTPDRGQTTNAALTNTLSKHQTSPSRVPTGIEQDDPVNAQSPSVAENQHQHGYPETESVNSQHSDVLPVNHSLSGQHSYALPVNETVPAQTRDLATGDVADAQTPGFTANETTSSRHPHRVVGVDTTGTLPTGALPQNEAVTNLPRAVEATEAAPTLPPVNFSHGSAEARPGDTSSHTHLSGSAATGLAATGLSATGTTIDDYTMAPPGQPLIEQSRPSQRALHSQYARAADQKPANKENVPPQDVAGSLAGLSLNDSPRKGDGVKTATANVAPALEQPQIDYAYLNDPVVAAERAQHLRFIGEALDMARLALQINETPVGCVLVHDGKVIARGMNATNVTRNGTRHAEYMALAALFSYPKKTGPRTFRLKPKLLTDREEEEKAARAALYDEEAPSDPELPDGVSETLPNEQSPHEGNEDGKKGHLHPYGQKELNIERVDRSIVSDSVLYVTVEPCIMCASLLRQLKIKKVYFGAVNDKFGGTGGVFSVHANSLPVREDGQTASAHPIAKPIQLPDGTGGSLGVSFPPGGGDGGNVEPGYEIEGGWGRDEAVALLRRFYVQENGRAPVPRKKEGRAARLAAIMGQDGTDGEAEADGDAEGETVTPSDLAETGADPRQSSESSSEDAHEAFHGANGNYA